jgi:translocation and assembly module TamA
VAQKNLIGGLAFACVLSGQAALALDFSFLAPGARGDLWEAIATASLTRESTIADDADEQSIFAAARADYARIVSALYDNGYYSPQVSIKLNGREASSIAPLDVPKSLSTVTVRINIGEQFKFKRATVEPLAPKTELPDGFREGEIARSSLIIDAAREGVSAWRDIGHAKADVGKQSVTANHRENTLAAEIELAPGPVARFGELTMKGYNRLRPARLAKIAGFPEGEIYSPEELATVSTRLRRTGIFSSVSLTEADQLNPDNSLDVALAVVEAKTRRIGAGVEIATLEGITLSTYWLHRNLFGGGEGLRIDGEVGDIGGTLSGVDYGLSARIDRPATFTPDTTAYIETEVARDDEPDDLTKSVNLEFGVSHIFHPRLTGELGIAYRWSDTTEDTTRTIFRQIAFPGNLTFDNRDEPLNATKGYYGSLDATPFYGLGEETGTGIQLKADARAYRGFGEDAKYVLAARLQAGSVLGSDLEETPRDYLFYSGGGGTVRGHPYESLGVSVLDGGTRETGGAAFLAASGEIRANVTETIGIVAFYDTGYVGATSFSDGEWQTGAGLGLRYNTGIGPIRLDVAGPVSGSTGDGGQIYIGIGQAF